MNQWIPQFPDGSGWSLEDEDSPCFYEHVTHQEAEELKVSSAEQLYKIVCITPYPPPYHKHKNTYFIKGSHLDSFFEGYSETTEYIVSIERVERMPSTDEKLT